MKVAPSDVCFPAQMQREGAALEMHRGGGGAVPGGRGLPSCGEAPAGRGGGRREGVPVVPGAEGAGGEHRLRDAGRGGGGMGV